MLKKILSVWALFAFIFSFNVVGGFNVVLVGAVDCKDIDKVRKESQVENYDLKRVLARKEEKIGYFLEYEHQKTGARFVCEPDYDSAIDGDVSVFYKVASEDNTGAVHALEHCVYSDMLFEPEDEIDLAPRAYTMPVGVFFRAANVSRSDGRCPDSVVSMIDALKNPRFLSDESVFKSEVFNRMTAKDGKPLAAGRVFIEIEENNRGKAPAETRAIYENRIMNSNSKFKFEEGGLPKEICNCSYEKVCELYRKYIHPSNMAVLVRGKNFRDVMRQFHKSYMNGFERKDIAVDYMLQNEDIGSFFKEYGVEGLSAALRQQKDYKYCAVAAYPLKSVKDCDISTFGSICCVFSTPEFKKYLLKLGYEDVDASIYRSPDCEYLKVAVMGNDAEKFDEKSLSFNFHEMLSEAVKVGKVEGLYSRNEFGIPHDPVAGRLFFSYALCGELFSDRFFTIRGNEIYYDGDCYDRDCSNNASFIDKELASGFIEKPAEIVLLKDVGGWKRQGPLIYKFKLAFCENDIGKIRLAMRILNRGLVSKFLQQEGKVYSDLYVNGLLDECPSVGASEKDLFCLSSEEIVSFDSIFNFFDNDFDEKVKNFEVSDELFDLVRSNIIGNKVGLRGVFPLFKKFLKNQVTIKERIFDVDSYCANNFVANSNILDISKDEIQKFIRTARFVGYAVSSIIN